jgi:hypothetical protein
MVQRSRSFGFPPHHAKIARGGGPARLRMARRGARWMINRKRVVVDTAIQEML